MNKIPSIQYTANIIHHSWRGRVPGFILVFLILCVPCSFAQTVTLPLKGYFKPGRYMPVRLEGVNRDCVVSGDGIVPTDVDAGNDRIVPLLSLTSSISSIYLAPAGGETIEIKPTPRSLPFGERLVAVTSTTLEPVAKRLFPGEPVTVIVIEPSDLASARAIVWDALDGLVTDSAAFKSIGSSKVEELLSGGMTIATLDEAGEAKKLQKEVVGPSGATIGETAYLPVASWRPGQTAALRRQVVVVAFIVILLLLGCLLLPRRTSIAAIVGVGILSSVGIAWWSSRQSGIRTVGGSIAVVSDRETQVDTWTYATTRGDELLNIPLRAPTWPIVAGVLHAQSLALKIHDSADGSIVMQCRLHDDSRLAWLHRSFVPSEALDERRKSHSLLSTLLRPLYGFDEKSVLGQQSVSDAEWGMIYLPKR